MRPTGATLLATSAASGVAAGTMHLRRPTRTDTRRARTFFSLKLPSRNTTSWLTVGGGVTGGPGSGLPAAAAGSAAAATSAQTSSLCDISPSR